MYTFLNTVGQRTLLSMRLNLDTYPVANLTLIGRNLQCESNWLVFIGYTMAIASSSDSCPGISGGKCKYIAERSVAASRCFFDCSMENAVYESLAVHKYTPDSALQICEAIIGFNC